MVSSDFIFWEVDAQIDFMFPEGKLYVPGAERLLPKIRRLADAALFDLSARAPPAGVWVGRPRNSPEVCGCPQGTEGELKFASQRCAGPAVSPQAEMRSELLATGPR